MRVAEIWSFLLVYTAGWSYIEKEKKKIKIYTDNLYAEKKG